jgi:uncharacterized protein YecT (DUF1311 family)
MKFLAVLPLIFLTSFSCMAQDSKLFRSCNENAKSQAEMNVCANEEAVRTDTELNNVYRTLLSKAGSQPEAVAKIQIAERAWIAYRNAYIDAMYPAKNKQAEYGTMYAMEVALLHAKLTRQQVAALKDMLQQYVN